MNSFLRVKLAALTAIVLVSGSAGAEEKSEAASPDAKALCEQARKEYEALDKLPAESQLSEGIRLLGSLPEAETTDPEVIKAAVRKDLVEASSRYLFPAPNCANVRLQLIRLLTKLSKGKNVSDADKSRICDGVLAAVTRPHSPFVIESMINLGALDEAVKGGLFPLAGGTKAKIEKRVKQAKASVQKGSRDIDKIVKGTALEDARATEAPEKMAAFFKDPKNEKVAEKYKAIVLSEIDLAREIQADTDKLAEELRAE